MVTDYRATIPPPPADGSPRTFKHSGDLGDIIFSLPTIRALGGGILYLDPQGGKNDAIIATTYDKQMKLDAAGIDSLKPLLMLQSYIKDVRYWAGETVDVNLDQFRLNQRWYNLPDMVLDTFGQSLSHRDTAWLSVPDPISVPDYPFVINRSVRYHGNWAFWKYNLNDFASQSLFVGFPKEHEIFEYTFGVRVKYQPTPTIRDLARYIAGCRQFIGNASLPHALAEAMKKPLIAEMFRVICTICCERPGAQYV